MYWIEKITTKNYEIKNQSILYNNTSSMIPFLWKFFLKKATKVEKWHDQICILDPILKMKRK